MEALSHIASAVRKLSPGRKAGRTPGIRRIHGARAIRKRTSFRAPSTASESAGERRAAHDREKGAKQ